MSVCLIIKYFNIYSATSRNRFITTKSSKTRPVRFTCLGISSHTDSTNSVTGFQNIPQLENNISSTGGKNSSYICTCLLLWHVQPTYNRQIRIPLCQRSTKRAFENFVRYRLRIRISSICNIAYQFSLASLFIY